MLNVIVALILIGLAITIIEALWNLIKLAVSAIWIPGLVIASVLVILAFIEFLTEQYVKTKSTTYKMLKELYEMAKKLPKPQNIDLTGNTIILNGEETLEEVFFVDYHNQIQKQLDLIKDNNTQIDKIVREKQRILKKYEESSKRICFENHVICRYDRKIRRALISIPKEIKAKVPVSQARHLKEVRYSGKEVKEYNDKYMELVASLEKKREFPYKKGAEERKLTAQEEQKREDIKRERAKLSASLRYDVLKRDDFRCTICGRSAADGVTLHVDHIKPVSKGGKTEIDNLRTLCDYCNLGKSDKYDPDGIN